MMLKSTLKQLYLSIHKNSVFFVIYLMSTIFFLYQHHIILGWDFSAYVLNAKSLFGNGSYLEIHRAPLVPLIIFILSFAGYRTAEFLYIFLVSSLYALSCFLLGKSLKVNPALFYFFSLQPFVLVVGMLQGSEILSLALMNIFLSSILDRRNGGLFLGLALLARYQNFIFVMLTLWYRNLKKITLNLLIAATPVVVWLIYSKVVFGNFFASIFDAYMMNIKFASYMHPKLNLSHFFAVMNYLLPFVIAGFVVIFFHDKKQNKIKHSSRVFHATLMLTVIVLAVYSYLSIKIRIARYLFPLVTPIAFFSSAFFSSVKLPEKRLLYQIIITYFVASFIILKLGDFADVYSFNVGEHKDVIGIIKTFNRSNCAVSSNSYTYLNYLGMLTVPYPRKGMLKYYLDEGYTVVLFTSFNEPSYAKNISFLERFPLLYRDERFLIIANKSLCKLAEPYKKSFLERLNETTTFLYGYHTPTNGCAVIFKNNLLQEICTRINLWELAND